MKNAICITGFDLPTLVLWPKAFYFSCPPKGDFDISHLPSPIFHLPVLLLDQGDQRGGPVRVQRTRLRLSPVAE